MVSTSPIFAVLGLIFLARALAVKVGLMYINWFFFVLIVVYVGGIIVMFIYLARLMQGEKIPPLGPSVLLLAGAPSACIVWARGLQGRLPELSLWVNVRMWLVNGPLVIFLIFYLLVALIGVCRICEKVAGPIKRGS